MSELAMNERGERIPMHADTAELRVFRCQSPGRPGAPGGVAAPNGLAAYLPRNATIEDLRTIVREAAGRYKLVQVDQQRRPLVGAEAFYLEIFDTSRLPATNENDERDGFRELVRVHGEMIRSNNETVSRLFDRAGGMFESAGRLLGAADGAGLPAREPLAQTIATLTAPALDVPAAPHAGVQMLVETLGRAAPLIQHLLLTKVLGLTPEQVAQLFGAMPPPTISPSPSPTLATPPPPSAPTPPPAPVDPIAHMNAIEALLAPREKRIAFELIQGMTPDQIGAWRGHLCTMSAADAASAIRAEIAQLDAKRAPSGTGGAS